jgi:hypothetical protein
VEPKFTLFVSCVEGQLATRFGTRTFIGAERDQKTNEIHWFPDRIVAIPAAEHARHRKEYDRLVADGDLLVHTEADWKAFCELEAEAEKQSRQRAEEARATPPAKE